MPINIPKIDILEKEQAKQVKGKNFFDYLSKIESQLKEKAENEILFRPPIIRDLLGNGIVYPSTIVMIQGKTGVHKSRLMESIAVLILARDSERVELGFRMAEIRDYVLVLVDTERNKSDQLPAAIQSILHKAGLQVSPPNFRYTSILDIPREERFQATSDFIGGIKKTMGNEHLIVILDVVSDCVLDINNNRECFPLIDMINREINNSNATFFVIIHENPGIAEKARGALGTELANKASTIMQISFEKEKGGGKLIKLDYKKMRSSECPEAVYLEYDKIAKGLVLAATETIHAHPKDQKDTREMSDIIDYLAEILKEGDTIPSAKLKADIAVKFGISETTANRRLQKLLESKAEIIDTNVCPCFLELVGTTRTSSYKLSKK